MMLAEAFRSGVQAILAHRLRSALTMLGIMIGVAAVIVLVAFGQGASNSVVGSIQSLGTNLVTVFPARPDSGSTSQAVGELTVADAIALNDEVAAPDIRQAVPAVQASVTCTVDGRSHSTSMTGTWPGWFEATNSPVVAGAYFTNTDEVEAKRVAVIGPSVVDELFPDSEPLGRQISCNGSPFTVLGVLEEKGASGFGNPDDVVVAPLSTVENQISGYGGVQTISVQSIGTERTAAAEEQVLAILDARHRTTEETRDFQTFNQASLLQTANVALGIFTILLATVAGISLLVGGIGITNIMLVSVTERTREIGIRKAIGASRRVILLQFLMEATILSLLGAVAGLIIAFLVTQIEIADIKPTIVPASVVAAFIISVAIGLFFGSYPANRAASLRPIEALRHE